MFGFDKGFVKHRPLSPLRFNIQYDPRSDPFTYLKKSVYNLNYLPTLTFNVTESLVFFKLINYMLFR